MKILQVPQTSRCGPHAGARLQGTTGDGDHWSRISPYTPHDRAWAEAEAERAREIVLQAVRRLALQIHVHRDHRSRHRVVWYFAQLLPWAITGTASLGELQRRLHGDALAEETPADGDLFAV